MSDSANSFSSLKPLLKETYASGSPESKLAKSATSYSTKLQKIAGTPGSSEKYFSHIKKYLKKAKHKK